MQKYQGVCEDCGHKTEPTVLREQAERALSAHRCPPKPKRCHNCNREFVVLVDDELCIRCDALMFPAVA